MPTSSVVEFSPPEDLRNLVRCTYEARFDDGAYTLFPDGCIDLVWGCGALSSSR